MCVACVGVYLFVLNGDACNGEQLCLPAWGLVRVTSLFGEVDCRLYREMRCVPGIPPETEKLGAADRESTPSGPRAFGVGQ